MIPEYLNSVPKDPYGGGESLRYRLQGQKYVLWSIGPDGKDDQAKPIVNPDKKGDAQYRFLFPESLGDVVLRELTYFEVY